MGPRAMSILFAMRQVLDVASFMWRPKTREFYLFPETLRVFEPKPTVELTCDNLMRRIRPEDRTEPCEILDQVLRNKKAFGFEHRLVMSDGSVRHVLANGHPLHSSRTEVTGYAGTVCDITEYAQSAEALHGSLRPARHHLTSLKQAIAALAHDSEPEGFLAHVLSAIGNQINAHSFTVWQKNPVHAGMELFAVHEGGELRFPTRDEGPLGVPEPCCMFDHPLWKQFLETGEYCIHGEIISCPPRLRIAFDQNSLWHQWLSGPDMTSVESSVIGHLVSMDVSALLFVPMLIAGKVTGMLSIRFQHKPTFSREEIELTRAMAHQTMLAIQIICLSRQSRRAAVFEERNRLARDIHDTLAQGITSLILQLEAATDATSHGAINSAESHLIRAIDMARVTLREARRSVKALRPQSLDGKRDLCAALNELIQLTTKGSNIQAVFVVSGQPRAIPPPWEDHLLHITQEVVTNVIRHSKADRFDATLAFDENQVCLELRDNGHGFDTNQCLEGFGLIGIRERAKAMSGKLQLASEVGCGTLITLAVPLSNCRRLVGP